MPSQAVDQRWQWDIDASGDREATLQHAVAIASTEATGPFFPSHIASGLLAAVDLNDKDAVSVLNESLKKGHRGRAINGLRHVGEMTVAWVDGDMNEAARHYAAAMQLWTDAGSASDVASANALAVRVFGLDTAIGHDAAVRLYEFTKTAGAVLWLDRYADIFEALDIDTAADLAV